MRCQMDQIWIQGSPESKSTQIYDAMYWIQAKKSRWAYASLVAYKRRIEHVRLDVQAQHEELRSRDQEGETCPNCRVKRMQVRAQPLQPFWETVRNAPPGPGERRPYSRREEICAIQIAEEMNKAMREVIEERRHFQLIGIRGFIGPLTRLIGLLDESVRKGRRVWALPSPFPDLWYGRDIVPPFPVLQHLQHYLVVTLEHRACEESVLLHRFLNRRVY